MFDDNISEYPVNPVLELKLKEYNLPIPEEKFETMVVAQFWVKCLEFSPCRCIINRLKSQLTPSRGMSRLPRISGKECVKVLSKAGFYLKRQEGSHIILRMDEPFCQFILFLSAF